MNKDNKFNEYVDNYKKLPLQEKKRIVNNETKKLLAFIDKASKNLNIENEILLNKELADLNSDNVSDDDFVEAMFVCIYSIQESLGKYFNEVSKKLYR